MELQNTLQPTRRTDRIVEILRSGPASAWSIATVLNAPQASVRRDVQTLRRIGYRIDDARDYDGLYRLWEN